MTVMRATAPETQFAQPIQPDNPAGVRLTQVAAEKVKALLEREAQPETIKLRVEVQPGGCSGLRHNLVFDDQPVAADDQVTSYDGFDVVVDSASLAHIGTAIVDFSDGITGRGFTIDNPSATKSCACGESFC